MTKPTEREEAPRHADPGPERPQRDEEDPRKLRVPSGPVEQRPDEEPIGNGGTGGPPAFPPHN